MNRTFASSLALAALCGFGPTVCAQQEQRLQADPGALFERIDANKDGVLTADEFPEERKKTYFERLLRTGDKDKDGKLTREEFTAANQEPQRREEGPPPGAGPRPEGAPMIEPERAFRFMDRNGDGKLTPDEVPEERRDRFKAGLERTDKDGDGALNLEEFKAGAEAMARMLGRGPGGFPGGPPNLANAPFFRAIDANGDGKLSGDELAKAGDALKTLDRNKDGMLTPEELAPPGGPMRPDAPRPADNPQLREVQDRLKRADTNGDGKLSKDEAPDRLKENFDRIDANGDGFIDAAEAVRIFNRRPQNQPDGDTPRRRPQRDENK